MQPPVQHPNMAMPQSSPLHHQQQQQQQHQQQQQQNESKLDHVTQCKLLVAKLKQVLSETMRTAALAIGHNGRIDSGTARPGDVATLDFERMFEKFLMLCDLIEHNLRSALECSSQTMYSQRYTPLPVGCVRADAPTQGVEPLTYNQYVGTARVQIQMADQIRTMLQEAAQLASGSNPSSDAHA